MSEHPAYLRPVPQPEPSAPRPAPKLRRGVPLPLFPGRSPQCDSMRFLDAWRDGQKGPIRAIWEIPEDGLALGDNACGRMICMDALDARSFDDSIPEVARVLEQEGVALLVASLRGNPAVRAGMRRKLVPGDPVTFRRAEALDADHIDRLRAHFGGIEVRLFDVLSPALGLFENALARLSPRLPGVLAPLWPVVRAADRFLLNWRPVRRRAGTAIVVLRWPRRHIRD